MAERPQIAETLPGPPDVRAFPASRSSDTDRLRARYAELAREALSLSADSRVRRGPLLDAALDLVPAGKAAYAAIQGLAADVPAEEVLRGVDDLLDGYSARIEPLRAQLRLLERIAAYAGELFGILQPLSSSGRGSFAPALGLARRILLDVRESSAGRLDMPLPGIDVASMVSHAIGRPECAAVARSVVTARLVAWTAPQFLRYSSDAEALTAASLLLDAGIVAWQESRGMPPGELARARPFEFAAHPRLAAGLAAGLEGIPAAVPDLISVQRDPLDAVGAARRPSWRISSAARLLQVIVRFAELRFCPVPGTTVDAAAPASDADAARTVWDEAERGRWDLDAARALLQAIDLVPARRPLDEPSKSAALSAFGRRRLRTDAAHLGVPRPHAVPSTGNGSAPPVRESLAQRPHFLKARTLAGTGIESNG